jgi:hypothetical protein
MAENERPIEAVKQLRICLKLRPKFRQAEKLLGELSLTPQVISQSLELEDAETK